MSRSDRSNNVRSDSVSPEEGEVSDDVCSDNLAFALTSNRSASLLLASGARETVGFASSVGITTLPKSVTSTSDRNFRNRQRRKRSKEIKQEQAKLQKSAHQTDLVRIQSENQLRSEQTAELARQQFSRSLCWFVESSGSFRSAGSRILRLGQELSEKTDLLNQLKEALRSSAASKSTDQQAKEQEISWESQLLNQSPNVLPSTEITSESRSTRPSLSAIFALSLRITSSFFNNHLFSTAWRRFFARFLRALRFAVSARPQRQTS